LERYDVPELEGETFAHAKLRESGPEGAGATDSQAVFPPSLVTRVAGRPEVATAGHGTTHQARRAQPGPRLGWRGFLREHWLIGGVLLAATLVRVVTLLAYPPAFWYPDSDPYIQSALQAQPYFIRPVGYSFLLVLLEPAHSILFVIAVQHVMGVGVGLLIYALLRRHKMPAWGSTLAAIPPLASAYTIQIEHYVLSDAFFGLLVMGSLALVLWRPRPRIWVCGAVGLLLAWAALDRSQGLLLIAPFVLYLAIARLGLRRFVLSAATMSVAFAVPVLAYCWWYDQTLGSFDMTTSTGAFLYAKTAVFAECSIDKPPADERWLCVSAPVSKRQGFEWYLWSAQSPIQHGPGSEFSSKVNGLATQWALRAITAQPTAYLKVVVNASLEAIKPEHDTNQSQTIYLFPAAKPESEKALAIQSGEDPSYAYSYNGGANPSTRVVQPYARWLLAYQRYVVVSGPFLGVIVLLGLLGAALAWRRGGPAWFAWITGAALIVTPAATADYDARYVVSCLPVFCFAAALGVREIYGRTRALPEIYARLRARREDR
jgi:hypothetical protein